MSMRLNKNQLDRRKKRRLRSKQSRAFWKAYIRELLSGKKESALDAERRYYLEHIR